MKGIVITTGNEISVKDFGEPLYKTVGAAVGGLIEIVRPRGLKRPFCMIVNDEGLIRNLPINPIGSLLYQSHKHGQPIAGDIVIMKENECDITGLEDAEISQIKDLIRKAFIEAALMKRSKE